MKDFPQVEVGSRREWRDWLAANADGVQSVWLITFKKGSARHVSYDEAVEEALCFGWIDSLPRRLDEARTMLLMSPRRPESGWSKVNKDRVERLTASGLMAEAGLAAIDRARADGSWTKLDAVSALVKPEDLTRALASEAPANAHFDAFPPSVRRGILEWIEQAKSPETRARRIVQTTAAAARNERVGQWRKRTADASSGGV